MSRTRNGLGQARSGFGIHIKHMRIGLLGGTFNPIHMGHMALAKASLARFSLDKVIFIPAYIPPHKKVQSDPGADKRLAMVRLAVRGNRKFAVSDHEIKKKGISYTIDTVKFFGKKCGKKTQFFFIAGSDSLKGLSKWKKPGFLLKLVNFVVAARPDFVMAGPYKNRIVLLDMPEVDVSSTDIRSRVRKGKAVGRLVPPAVAAYIRMNRLYRQNS